ncbi:MAG: type II toxin-antitoxin system VapC family toxin [Rhodothermales bacterium]
MATYLLDTNILLRVDDALAEQSTQARLAIETLITQDHVCCITPQVIGEYYSVATRPVASNGFGWSAEKGRRERDNWLSRYPLLNENAEIFPLWMQLIDQHGRTGRRIFDLRLLAVMRAHHIMRLLTFDVEDFPLVAGCTIVHPKEVRVQ